MLAIHPLLVVLAVSALTLGATPKDFECASEDLAHSSLISAGRNGGFLTCTYSQAGLCAYSEDGFFSVGSSTCPDTLPANQNDIHAASSTICPQTDDGGSNLIGSGVSGKFKTCTYAAAGVCTYFSDGSFSSGGSVCPDTIIPSSCVCIEPTPKESSGSISPQGDAVLAASDSSASRKAESNLSPALITLLVLNAVLVVISLIFGAMLIRARRAAGTSSRLNAQYAGLDASGLEFGSPSRLRLYYSDSTDKDSVSVPLTHGGAYSDTHE
ncbi:hypothetical protein MVEN_01662500 [Mycena venus]|uniref:Uncharacterized protein n=1 Tax=Mycena venus TaxID=2733690 RepID=A0A8H7CQY3_9AGAR|nr:hypothetical protein MVEN_01662500 [Mycena venus]